jgi:hypothetical protein
MWIVQNCVKFVVLTEVNTNSSIFWVITLCNSVEVHWRSEELSPPSSGSTSKTRKKVAIIRTVCNGRMLCYRHWIRRSANRKLVNRLVLDTWRRNLSTRRHLSDSVYALLLHKRQSFANYAFLTANLDILQQNVSLLLRTMEPLWTLPRLQLLYTIERETTANGWAREGHVALNCGEGIVWSRYWGVGTTTK